MSRGVKNTVDYFPHLCKHGKSMFIIESKYNNDGYAVWFKILEILGQSENHYIDLRKDEDYEYVLAKMKVSGSLFNDILNTLSKIGSIHQELWENKIIWSWNFINNIQDAYKRRNAICMHFNDLCIHLNLKCKHKYTNEGIYVCNNQQSILKDSKVNNNKVKYADNVLLFKNEYEKLITDYGKENTEKMIICLNNYKGANGKNYKSDYLAILNWVVDKIMGRPEPKPEDDKHFKPIFKDNG